MKPCVALMRVTSPSSIGKILKNQGLALELEHNAEQRCWMRCTAGVPTLKLKGHHAVGHKAACRKHSQANADGAMSDSHAQKTHRSLGLRHNCVEFLDLYRLHMVQVVRPRHAVVMPNVWSIQDILDQKRRRGYIGW